MTVPRPPKWGRFLSPGAKTENLVEDGNDRNVRMLEDFSYEDTDVKVWTTPRGAISDGSTKWWILWGLVGGPYTGDERDIAYIHDWYCQLGNLFRAIHARKGGRRRERERQEALAKWRQLERLVGHKIDFRERWQDVHLMWYRGARCRGVSAFRAWRWHTAMKHFGGPRWPDPTTKTSS